MFENELVEQSSIASLFESAQVIDNLEEGPRAILCDQIVLMHNTHLSICNEENAHFL